MPKNAKKAILNKRKLKKIVVRAEEDPLGWAKLVCGYAPIPSEREANLEAVKNSAIVMIVNILENCKDCFDRSAAIRKIREALMYAESAIVIDWEDPE